MRPRPCAIASPRSAAPCVPTSAIVSVSRLSFCANIVIGARLHRQSRQGESAAWATRWRLGTRLVLATLRVVERDRVLRHGTTPIVGRVGKHPVIVGDRQKAHFEAAFAVCDRAAGCSSKKACPSSVRAVRNGRTGCSAPCCRRCQRARIDPARSTRRRAISAARSGMAKSSGAKKPPSELSTAGREK